MGQLILTADKTVVILAPEINGSLAILSLFNTGQKLLEGEGNACTFRDLTTLKEIAKNSIYLSANILLNSTTTQTSCPSLYPLDYDPNHSICTV